MAQKNPIMVTPVVTFFYPRLGQPDTKFKAEGEYSVKVRGMRADMESLIAKLNPLYSAAKEAAEAELAEMPIASRKKLEAKGGVQMNPLFQEVFDKESEQPTGEVELTFKMTASGVFRNGSKAGQTWKRKPDVFDAKLKPMSGAEIWSGTKGRVKFEVRPYFISGTGIAGLRLGLLGAQVIELVNGSSNSSGFDMEDGYEAPAQEPIKAAAVEAANGDDSEDDTDF